MRRPPFFQAVAEAATSPYPASGTTKGMSMPHERVSSVMSRASCHFSTCPTSAGMPQRPRRATSASASGEAGSLDAGRNSRQFTAAET